LHHCREAIRTGSLSFHAASKLLPAKVRDPALALYAFCRLADDIADTNAMPEAERESELARWKKCALDCEAPGHPVLDEVIELPGKYGFPRLWLAEIIDGVASDICVVRYETFEELLGYCYKVASVVGLVSVHIFGHQNPQAREYAVQLGYALQLTNIIRDVGEDALRGRIYLPVDELQQFQVTAADLLNRRDSLAFQALMQFQTDRALALYEEALAMLPVADWRAQKPGLMMASIYRTLLHEIAQAKFPVLKQRVSLTPVRKLWLAWKMQALGRF
jgi:phytoene synthase